MEIAMPSIIDPDCALSGDGDWIKGAAKAAFQLSGLHGWDVGDAVDIEWHDSSYPGIISSRNEDLGCVAISYDNYGPEWDELIPQTSQRLSPRVM